MICKDTFYRIYILKAANKGGVQSYHVVWEWGSCHSGGGGGAVSTLGVNLQGIK